MPTGWLPHGLRVAWGWPEGGLSGWGGFEVALRSHCGGSGRLCQPIPQSAIRNPQSAIRNRSVVALGGSALLFCFLLSTFCFGLSVALSGHWMLDVPNALTYNIPAPRLSCSCRQSSSPSLRDWTSGRSMPPPGWCSIAACTRGNWSAIAGPNWTRPGSGSVPAGSHPAGPQARRPQFHSSKGSPGSRHPMTLRQRNTLSRALAR